MAPRKRDTQVQEDGQTVYKPAKKAKTVVKEEPEDKKPVRLKPARTKTGRLKPEAEKEEKKPDKKPPRRYEPEQKLTGREKKEKARAAAVARDRRRAVSRAGDGCVTMIALLTAEEGIQPSELSLMLGASRTSGTRIADELEARGWVCRQGVAEDRRCHRLMLTEQGQAFLTDMLPRQRNRLREIWQPFSSEEREQFMRLLRKVLEVMPE